MSIAILIGLAYVMWLVLKDSEAHEEHRQEQRRRNGYEQRLWSDGGKE